MLEHNVHWGWGAALLLMPTYTFAARPFVTDDARITDDRACQLESWYKRDPDRWEVWALPACNPFGNLETTLGAGYGSEDANGELWGYVIQGKTLAKALEPNSYGWGFAAGGILHPEIATEENQLGSIYVYMPLSFSLHNDVLVMHTNLGWLHDRDEHLDKLTWGIGSEIPLNAWVTAIAEIYGDNRENPFWQVGVRLWLIPNQLQLDGTTGGQLGEGEDNPWFSIGLRLLGGKIFEKS